MTDKELLELAAKAAERNLTWYADNPNDPWDLWEGCFWNPLIDDAQALRLTVKLNIAIRRSDKDDASYAASPYGPPLVSEVGSDPYAATRRAIVRAAAEIGKTL